MSNVWFIRRKHLIVYAVGLAAVLAAALVIIRNTSETVDSVPQEPRAIHMITSEFSGKLANGQEIESYRWDPGTIFVEKGETVKLRILGVNGDAHPFYIEGTTIKGEVKKGKETVVTFKPEKEGVYRIICVQHPDASHSGPMIGYIVVD